MGLSLVRPLEEAWKSAIDDVLRGMRAPTFAETATLGAKVAELSRAYNDGDYSTVPLEARVAFSFARDVPKGAAAVRELVASGLLALSSERPLRVVDLGAGLGAMTWGLARALDAAGHEGTIEALLVDADEKALAAAEALARRAPPAGVRVTVKTRVTRVASGMKLPRADVVVLGQVVSELDVGAAEEERVTKHAALVRELLADVVDAGGALVIVEPALRERTRHLHAVRDAVLRDGSGAGVFAPCPHAKACPALAVPREWCHEDLAVDLPEWLVPLARAAGLRWQGLTFSYLVLRRDGAAMTDALPLGRRVRLVSHLLRTKGKTEMFVCTDEGTRIKLRRLDRESREGELDDVARGDVAVLTGEIDEGGRLSPAARIDVWHAKK